MIDMDETTYLDGRYKGNCTRHINHSHDPNLSCFPKYVLKKGGYIKQLWFYAIKEIPEGTELVYDYRLKVDDNSQNPIRCYCDAADCPGYLEEGYEHFKKMKDWICSKCLEKGHSKKQC